jgi:hypothetical protein
MIHMEITIKGKIDPSWSDWFEGMSISQAGPERTQLAGDLLDQSAVFGVLSRLSSLHLALISVACCEIKE